MRGEYSELKPVEQVEALEILREIGDGPTDYEGVKAATGHTKGHFRKLVNALVLAGAVSIDNASKGLSITKHGRKLLENNGHD